MNEVKTLHVTNRKDWRRWLEENYNKEEEIWLVYPKKSSGKKRIEYNDAVEEALCFGWIDSTARTFNQESTIQRFSPRNPKSGYSQPNKERIKWLLEQDMIHPSMMDKAKDIAGEEFIFPADIIDFIKRDDTTLANYVKFPASYRRIRVAYIDAARKRPDEFNRRLRNFIEKTREGKLIKGHGGIDKYYYLK